MATLLFPLFLVVALGGAQQLPKGAPGEHGGATPTEYRTSFSCVERVAGYYADIESGCQLYHLCDVDGRRTTHSCPNATLFQQRMMICDHWYMVDCNKSVHDYKANLLIGQRDKPFVGDDHNHHREPVNFFTIPQNPGSLQQPNWFPLVEDRPKQESEDVENAVPSPPPTTSSIHIGDGHRRPLDFAADSPPPGQRQARNRNLGPDNSYLGRPSSTEPSPFPRSDSGTPDGRFPSSVAPEKVSVRPQYSQTRSQPRLPEAYEDNPFLQSYVSKTPPRKVQINPPRDHKTIHPRPPVILEDIAHVKFSFPGILPEQSSSRRTKEFSFERNGQPNLPPHLRDHKIPDTFSTNQYYQPSTRPVLPTPNSANRYHHISENEDDLDNVVELHLLDPRQMFYIPESKTHDVERANSTVLYISVPAPTHNGNKRSHGVMQFRSDVKVLKGHNPECPKCHPAFLSPGRCHPCVVIR